MVLGNSSKRQTIRQGENRDTRLSRAPPPMIYELAAIPSGVSAQIMGHKPSVLAEKHYRHHPLDILRQ